MNATSGNYEHEIVRLYDDIKPTLTLSAVELHDEDPRILPPDIYPTGYNAKSYRARLAKLNLRQGRSKLAVKGCKYSGRFDGTQVYVHWHGKLKINIHAPNREVSHASLLVDMAEFNTANMICGTADKVRHRLRTNVMIHVLRIRFCCIHIFCFDILVGR